MKASVLYGVEDLRHEEMQNPIAGKGEVLIRVKAAGICGSDVPRVNGHAAHAYPIVLGHEFSGIIEQVGEGAEGLAAGQRATAAPLVPCMACADCLRGNYALCKHYSFIGSRINGSFAELVKAPARNVITFDDSVSFEQGAFFEPSTIALHGLRCVDYRGGEDVAILGGGTIGLFTMQWAKILGAKRTVVFDLSDERLALAKKLGADETVNTLEEGSLAEAMAHTHGNGYAFVFETAGQNATMNIAFEVAANKAGVCFIGTASKDLHFDWKLFEKMNRKEFRLTGSWMSYSAPFPGMEWTMTAEYFSNGKLRYDPSMVYKTYPMCAAADAFRLYKTPGAVRGKLMLVND